MSLSGKVDKLSNPALAKAAADELIGSNKVGRQVFTDASLTDGKAGVGILIMEDQHNSLAKYSIRLSDNISIYKAELHGILLALAKVYETGYSGKLILYTDSMSCVQSISTKRSYTNPNALDKIFTQAAKFSTMPTVTWIPSHVGINGNEVVDALAREAIKKPNIEYELSIYRTKFCLHVI